ncbi:MAG: hypothetical protein NTX31_17870 [Burkholderiales bacterium]|jgi:hypothetical protein|nr:hypothetical protein [Burkholderiales bacterium]
MKAMTALVLLKPHTHAGKAGEPGERIDVDEITAQWLLANGVATQSPKPVKAEPDFKPFQTKEPKP